MWKRGKKRGLDSRTGREGALDRDRRRKKGPKNNTERRPPDRDQDGRQEEGVCRKKDIK